MAGAAITIAPLTYPGGDLRAALGRVGGAEARLSVRFPGGLAVTLGGPSPRRPRRGGLQPGLTSTNPAFDPSQPSSITGLSRMVGWTMEIEGIGAPPEPYRVWSGEGNLTLEDILYQGTSGDNGAFINVSSLTDEVSAPSARARVSIAVPTEAVREMLELDLGPVRVFLSYIWSGDGGRSWVRAPVGLAGLLSRPEFENGVYSVELETWAGDADRGEPRYWSHETQQSLYPGDRGFEFARSISQGVDIRWPP